MSEGRPWYREPESFIAMAALIVSVSAVVVGLYEAALQRKHDRAEVWPHVEIETFATPTGASVSLENTGIGPAGIKSVVVTVDSQPARNWSEVIGKLLGHEAPLFSNSSTVGHGLRAGDRITMVGLSRESIPPGFWKSVARVGIKVCYASVFEEYWTVTTMSLGNGGAWEQVKSCPEQRPDADF
jgi:hypothetical protein